MPLDSRRSSKFLINGAELNIINRAIQTKPAEVAAKEGAFNQTLLWFQTNLANAPSNGRNHAVRSTDTPVASVLLALVAILALSA